MGFATHLGPWLLGTVKNTTGTTAGLIQNTGCTIVTQTYNLDYTALNGSGSFNAIPAGSIITAVQFVTSAAFSSAATLKLTIAGTDVNTASTITTAALVAVTPSTTFTPTWVNVGSTDALVTWTGTGTSLTTGAVTVVIAYAVRNSNGAMQPSTTQN